MRRWMSLAVVALVAVLGLAAVAAAANSVPKRGTIRALALAGTGTETSPGAPGCQFNPGYCDVTFEGEAQFGPLAGLPAGPWGWTSNLRIYWTKNDLGNALTPMTNGEGGFCAEAVGEFTVSHPKYGSFTAHQTGRVCEVGSTGSNVHVFEGHFTVVSSSGMKFGSNFAGGGTVSAYKDASGDVSVSLEGVQFRKP